MRNRIAAEPETRVGYCARCRPSTDLVLFKVPGMFRWRCAECFEREVGWRHHLSPPAPRIVLP